MGFFSKGYKEVKKRKDEQDRRREKASNRLFQFFLKEDGDEADLRFLNEEPIVFQAYNDAKYQLHVVPDGSEVPDGVTLTDKVAYLVIDRRSFTVEKDGKKKKMTNQLRLYIQGMKVASQLARISERYGLINRDVTISRLGSGTSTSYVIERGEDEGELSKKELMELIPENIRPKNFKGTQEELWKIIENQLMLYVDDKDDDEDDDEGDWDEDEDNETTSKNSKWKKKSRIIDVDDDEEEDEDDDEDEKPTKRKKSSIKKKTSLRRPKPANSIKRAHQLL